MTMAFHLVDKARPERPIGIAHQISQGQRGHKPCPGQMDEVAKVPPLRSQLKILVVPSRLPIWPELVDDVSAAQLLDLLVAGAVDLEMRQRWTGKEVVPKRTHSKCPRCGAWSSADRCPQCGAHRLSTELAQVRIEDRPKTVRTGPVE